MGTMIPLLRVDDSFLLTGRGLTVIYECILPDSCKFPFEDEVHLVTQEQTRQTVRCTFELAFVRRRNPPPYVVSMIFENMGKDDIPPGMVIEVAKSTYDRLHESG